MIYIYADINIYWIPAQKAESESNDDGDDFNGDCDAVSDDERDPTWIPPKRKVKSILMHENKKSIFSPIHVHLL